MKKLLYIIFLTIGLHLEVAHSVSLANRETDESVCDLAPLTTYRLGLKPFVPAGTRNESEIYFRKALRFITEKCINNQILLLHSEMGTSFDDEYFRKISYQVCTPKDIRRESAGTENYPQGFILRCPIKKLQEASTFLAELEAEKSTERMIEEGAPIRSNQPSHRDEEQKKCGESITWAMVVLGWGGNCR